VESRKRGIVYIADWPEDWSDITEHRFDGHWETGDEDRPVVHGPGWDDVEEAIKWGRERAPLVSIRIGTTTYSAGDENFEDDDGPRWESRQT
jgi:hypothetical protein